jgi:hypothetical protein
VSGNERGGVMSVKGKERVGVSCQCGGRREWVCHVTEGERESGGVMSVRRKERMGVSGQ